MTLSIQMVKLVNFSREHFVFYIVYAILMNCLAYK